MPALLFAAFASVLLSALLTPILRNIGMRWGLVDHPDADRKTHTTPIARIGGVPIFLTYITTCSLLVFLPLYGGESIASHLSLVLKLTPAAAIVFVTGLLDDIYNLKPSQKFIGQIIAATVAFVGGVHLTSVAGLQLPFWLTFPCTVLWLVGTCNAFNLIDGIDGLAAGIGLFATMTIIIAAGSLPLALATVPLAGALIGFLFFNFNPATIYLGDSGSLLIGFLLGSCAILWSEKAVTILGMTAPLMVLAVPLLDTAISVIRRYLRSKPLFAADQGHIHHRLLARGFSSRRVVFIIYGVSAIGACLSILETTYHQRYGVAVAIAFVLAVAAGIRYLDYAEFQKARRVFFGGNLRRILNAEMTLITLREELAVASNADDCWSAIRQVLPEFSFAGVELHLDGRTYSQISSRTPYLHSWTVRIGLSDTEYIHFLRDSSESSCPISADIIDAIGAILAAKAQELRQVVCVSPSDAKLYLVANN